MVLWCGLIFWFSSVPNLKVGEGASDFWLRKTAHMVEYGILLLLVYRALIKQKLATWRPKLALLAATVAIGYGVTDELHQLFIPTRTGKVVDIGIDALGVGIALVGLRWWGWYSRILSEAKPSD